MSKAKRERFTLGDWKVWPLRNLLVGPDGEKRVEPKTMEVLVELAARPGDVVTRDELLERIWPKSFSGDVALTRCISQLRSTLGDDRGQPQFIETIPKRGYRLIAPVTDEAIADEVIGTPGSSSNPTYWIAAAALATVLFIAAWVLTPDLSDVTDETAPAATTAASSIAVLPFVNTSGDEDYEHFSDGLTGTLINVLSEVPGLKVTARSSAFFFKGRDDDVREIANELGVTYVLEGTVQQDTSRIRVIATLVDGESGFHVWSKNYERELDDIFEVQDDIALEVVQAMKVALTDGSSIDSVGTESLDAYTAYLKGKYLAETETIDSLYEAIDEFEQATKLDPEFAPAYLAIADAYLTLNIIFSGGLSVDESNALAEPPLMKALQLDADSSQANATLGLLRQEQGALQAAEQAYEKSISQQPNSRALVLLGILRLTQERFEEAMDLFQEAFVLDPYSATVNYRIARRLLDSGNFDEALPWFHRTLAIEPDYALAHVYIGMTHHNFFGHVDESLFWYVKAAKIDERNPGFQAAPVIPYLEIGDADSAKLWLDKSLALGSDSFWPAWANLLYYTYIGDTEAALSAAHRLHEIDPEFWGALNALRNADLDAGRYEAARSRYARVYPELIEPEVPVVSESNYRTSVDLALVLMRNGEQKRADDLLEGSLRAIESIPRLGDGHWITDVRIYALQQRPQLALDALREAIDDGWRVFAWYFFDHDPTLDSLRDEPEFQRMVAEVKADMANQARRVAEMQASGDL